MALDKTSLKAALKALMTKEAPTSVDAAVNALADAIETYVKSADVNVSGVSVSVPGTGLMGQVPITGTASGSLSGKGSLE